MLALSLFFVFFFSTTIHAIETLEVKGDKLDFDLEKFELITNSEDKDVSETLLRLPNITRAGGANRPRSFQIRGIGDRGQFEHSQMGPVGVFYEGIDLSEEASVLPLLGREHMRVKYGPDSMKWGGKAVAGSVDVSSCLASNCPTFLGQLGYSRFDTFSGKFLTAIGNRFFIGGGATVSDGPYKNSFKNEGTHDLNEKQLVFGGRHTFSDWTIKHHHILSHTDNGYDTWNFDSSYNTLSDHPGKDKHKIHGHSLEWEKDNGKGIWKGLLSFTFTEQLESYDEDWGNDPYWNTIPGYNDNYNYYSEFDRERFKAHVKVSYLAANGIETGIHHYQYREKQDIRSYKDNALRKSKSPEFETIHTALWTSYTKNFESSDLRIAARIEDQRKELEDQSSKLKDNDMLWGWDIEYTHHHLKNLSSNLLLQKGYRGGGYNIDNTLLAYEGESLYHAQYSLMWRPETYFILGRVYSYWYRDQQTRESKQLDPTDPNTFSYFTSNAGRSYSQGIEFSISKSFERFKIHFNSGLMRAKFSEYQLDGINYKNRELPYAPKWNYQLRGEYFVGNFTIYSQIKGIGDYFYSVDHDHKAPKTYLVDTGVSASFGNLTLDFWVKNLFNKKHPIRAYYFANEPPLWEEKLYTQNSLPRTYGVDLTYSF